MEKGISIINLTELLYDAGANSPDFLPNDPVRPLDECFPNDCTGLTRITTIGAGFSQPYTQPASFMKVRELALTYALPIKSGVLKGMRLRVAGRNLFTVTNYRGLDPEVSNFGNQQVGRSIDVAPFPPSRSFWAGFDLTL